MCDYIKIELPPAERPVDYRQSYDRKRPVDSKDHMVGTLPGRIRQASTPSASQSASGYKQVAKEVSEDGKWWLITYRGPGGAEHTIKKLKGCVEGRG